MLPWLRYFAIVYDIIVTLFYYCLCNHCYPILLPLIFPWLPYLITIYITMVTLFCYCPGYPGYAKCITHNVVHMEMQRCNDQIQQMTHPEEACGLVPDSNFYF